MLYTDSLREAVRKGMVELDTQLKNLSYDHEDFDTVLSRVMTLVDFNYEMIEWHDDRLMDKVLDILNALGIAV